MTRKSLPGFSARRVAASLSPDKGATISEVGPCDASRPRLPLPFREAVRGERSRREEGRDLLLEIRRRLLQRQRNLASGGDRVATTRRILLRDLAHLIAIT